MSRNPPLGGWYGGPIDESLVRICAHNLLAAVDEAIYFKDLESRFLLVSQGQARRLGARCPADVVGKTDRDFFGSEHAAKAAADEHRVLSTGEPLVDAIEELHWPTREGTRWVNATKWVLRDADGNAMGTFGISHDITGRVLAEQLVAAKSRALEESHAELTRSQRQLKKRQRELQVTARALEQRAAELDAVARVSRAALTDDDVRGVVCSAVRELSDADLVTLSEPDGRGNLVLTAQAGFTVPRISLPLSQPSLVAKAFLSREAGIVADVHNDPEVSPTVVRMLEEIAGRPLQSAVYVPLVVGTHCLGVVTATLGKIRRDTGQLLAVLQIMANEAATAIERADLHRRLREQATHDVLTGLSNRRAILEHLEQAVARARRHNRGLGLLYVDLDGFKAVNDTYGHSTGDTVLVEAAARLRNAVRVEDNLGRIGGDEFVAICEDLNSYEDGVALKARVLANLAKPYQTLGVDLPIGASIGIAIWGADDDPETLLARADQAMYADKAARGRGGTRPRLVRPSPPA